MWDSDDSSSFNELHVIMHICPFCAICDETGYLWKRLVKFFFKKYVVYNDGKYTLLLWCVRFTWFSRQKKKPQNVFLSSVIFPTIFKTFKAK